MWAVVLVAAIAGVLWVFFRPVAAPLGPGNPPYPPVRVVDDGGVRFVDLRSLPFDGGLGALDLALEKVEGEDRTRDELKEGALLADVFEKYGVL